MKKNTQDNLCLLVLLFLVLPALVASECISDKDGEDRDKSKALGYKIAAIVSILFASEIGVLIPILIPEKNILFVIKAFAAGVLLATGFIYVLPDAFEKLRSPCLRHPWRGFPFTGCVPRCFAEGTLMADALNSLYFRKSHLNKGQAKTKVDEEDGEGHEGHLHLHTHATHGHSHGSAPSSASSELRREKVLLQIVELGIIAYHSVTIGISFGASESPKTIWPLVAAMTFHQFLEGVRLGSCITQANFKNKTAAIMRLFFALTTPVGIAIGIVIEYDEDSERGIFNAASAGILIYIFLVDLLVADFMNARIRVSKNPPNPPNPTQNQPTHLGWVGLGWRV